MECYVQILASTLESIFKIEALADDIGRFW